MSCIDIHRTWSVLNRYSTKPAIVLFYQTVLVRWLQWLSWNVMKTGRNNISIRVRVIHFLESYVASNPSTISSEIGVEIASFLDTLIQRSSGPATVAVAQVLSMAETSIASALWNPEARKCEGKILHNDRLQWAQRRQCSDSRGHSWKRVKTQSLGGNGTGATSLQTPENWQMRVPTVFR